MAQARTKTRKRKHRGTQGGKIDRRGRTSRPPKRQARGARTGAHRHDRPPTWRSAFTRGLFAAGIFLLLMMFLLGRTAGQALALSAFMLAFYVPLGFYTDSFFHRRRLQQRQAEREQKSAGRGSG